MSRKYIKIDEYGKQILEMKAQGKTSREIAQALGVDRECIRNWVFRFNRQQRKLEAGIKLQPKGRPRKDAQPRDIITEQAFVTCMTEALLLTRSATARQSALYWILSTLR